VKVGCVICTLEKPAGLRNSLPMQHFLMLLTSILKMEVVSSPVTSAKQPTSPQCKHPRMGSTCKHYMPNSRMTLNKMVGRLKARSCDLFKTYHYLRICLAGLGETMMI